MGVWSDFTLAPDGGIPTVLWSEKDQGKFSMMGLKTVRGNEEEEPHLLGWERLYPPPAWRQPQAGILFGPPYPNL